MLGGRNRLYRWIRYRQSPHTRVVCKNCFACRMKDLGERALNGASRKCQLTEGQGLSKRSVTCYLEVTNVARARESTVVFLNQGFPFRHVRIFGPYGMQFSKGIKPLSRLDAAAGWRAQP
jgi:hypothetical protein